MAFAKPPVNNLKSAHQSSAPYLAPHFLRPLPQPRLTCIYPLSATPPVAPSARLLRLPRPSPAPLIVPNLCSPLRAPPLVPPTQYPSTPPLFSFDPASKTLLWLRLSPVLQLRHSPTKLPNQPRPNPSLLLLWPRPPHPASLLVPPPAGLRRFARPAPPDPRAWSAS